MTEQFLRYQKEVKGLSELTIEEYRKDLKEFVSYASAKGLRWSTTTAEDLTMYVATLAEKKYQPATIRRRIATIKQIFKFGYHHFGLPTNPAAQLESPKLAKKLPKAANKEDYLTYLSLVPTTERSLFIHAFVALILETGMRISEALTLQTSQIDRKMKGILLRGKGAKERVVYFGELTSYHLFQYLGSRMGQVFTGHDAQEVRRMLIDELHGIIEHPFPHQIRHTYATEALNSGMDIYTLRQLLGHESVVTTERYLDSPSKNLQTAAGNYLNYL